MHLATEQLGMCSGSGSWNWSRDPHAVGSGLQEKLQDVCHGRDSTRLQSCCIPGSDSDGI